MDRLTKAGWAGRAEAVTPAASQLFSEIDDGGAADFELAGECLGFVGAFTDELEETGETALALDEGRESGFGGLEMVEGLFFEETGVGLVSGEVGDELDEIEEGFVVIRLNMGEVFGIGKD